MYQLKLVNEYNKEISLTGCEDRWQVVRVGGLNSPPAQISTSSSPAFDGERLNNARLDKRNIVIEFVINGNVEKNRLELNSVVLPKRSIRTYYKNGSRDVYIDGVVESFEYDLFDSKVKGQISILCPFPYFADANDVVEEFNQVISLFEFPTTFIDDGVSISELVKGQRYVAHNNGNVPCGVDIDIYVVNQTDNIEIVNTTTKEGVKLDGMFDANDVIKICTIIGKKSVKIEKNGYTINGIGYMTDDSDFLQLVQGDNEIAISGDVVVTFKHSNLYGGV